MPPTYSGRQIVSALTRLGFEHVHTRGSHAKMRKHRRTVTVPLHKAVAHGTFRSVCRQAGVTREELVDAM